MTRDRKLLAAYAQIECLHRQRRRDRAFILKLAERLYAAHEVLGRRAERKGAK